MPFSGPDDDSLPDRIKALPKETREKWVGAWNGTFKNCRDKDSPGGARTVEDCEGTAFKFANAAIKSKKCYESCYREVSPWEQESLDFAYEVQCRRVDQEQAAYTSLGGTSTKACANCQFFISPDDCSVVVPYPLPISPTGLSKFWAERVKCEMKPMEVVIVEAEKPVTKTEGSAESKAEKGGLIGFLRDKVVGLLNIGEKVISPQTSSFKLHKQTDGTYRWVAIVSNHFRDEDTPPEILTAQAHREFVAYLDKGGVFPETWLWHTPGTKWGKADWADFADGFLVMSGTVDDTKEALATAKSLAACEGLKVSHGFQQVYSDFSKGLIGFYRTFEISPLPAEVAANPWTGIEVLKKEAEMGFETKKREFLVGHLGEAKVAALESNTAAMAKALEDLGIEYKDAEGGKDATPDDVVANILVRAITASDPAEAAKAAALVVVESEGFKAITTAMEESKASLKSITDQILTMQATIKELQKSDDEKIAAILTSAASKAGEGFQASKEGPEPTEADSKDGPTVPSEWAKNLQNMVVSSIGAPSE